MQTTKKLNNRKLNNRKHNRARNNRQVINFIDKSGRKTSKVIEHYKK